MLPSETIRTEFPRSQSALCMQMLNYNCCGLPTAVCDKLRKTHNDNKSSGRLQSENMQPYSVVEDNGFCHMMKTAEPRYHIPSRTHFSSKVIPELYEVCRGDTENELRQAPYLALSTDCWTSCATVTLSCLTVTVHYILRVLPRR